ncbi:MAG TPA: hypothetical protein DEB70_11575 [Planctomycetaceae bacterium]|nr:hypothetical protein [Planctomycetaceae bacterium]
MICTPAGAVFFIAHRRNPKETIGAEFIQPTEHQILRLASPDVSLEVCVFALKIGPEKIHQILIFVSQLPHERCRHSLQLTEAKMLAANVHTYLLLRS